MILQTLPISSLNVADDSFRITYKPNLIELKNSIKRVGVVQPIVVRHTEDDRYQIVSGFKRVKACEDLGRQTIAALIFEHTELTPVQAFIRNVHENAFTRELNVIELSTSMSRLREFYGITDEDLVKVYFPLLKQEPSYKLLHQLVSISKLIAPMKEHVINSGMALSGAARISEFADSTQKALLDVLAPIRPNTNKLNELLNLIREISARDGKSVEEILERYQLLRIVTNPQASAPDKVSALRKTLHGVRMPELAKKEAEFSNLLKGLELPRELKLKADPYFENSKIKLEYQFSNPEELNVLVRKLEQAFETHAWNKIFDWYQA